MNEPQFQLHPGPVSLGSNKIQVLVREGLNGPTWITQQWSGGRITSTDVEELIWVLQGSPDTSTTGVHIWSMLVS